LKSVFEKLRFRDGWMWTEGLTGEISVDGALVIDMEARTD